MLKRALAACLAAVAALLAMPATAYVPSLSAALERQAAAAGRAAAQAHSGLTAQQYVAYHTPDALTIAPGQGSIDTIVIGTPYERVLYLNYLDAFEGATPSPADVDDASAQDTIDVILFAHSRDPSDQSFLRRFKGAAFTMAGSSLQPSRTAQTGPTKDFFNTPDGRQFLWLGTASFRFRIPRDDARASARFTVTDPYGKRYDIQVNLRDYR